MFKSRVRMTGAFLLALVFIVSCSCVSTPREKPADAAVEKPVERESAVEKPEETVIETPVPEEPEEEKSIAESLDELSSVDNSAEALALLEEAEELSLEEQILRAALMISEGQYEKAESELDQLLSDNPGHPDVLYNQALLEHALGNSSQRDRIVADILKANSDHEGALLMKGTVDLAAKRYAQANESFLTILKENPDNFMALSGGATAQMNLDRLESAVKLLDRAIDQEPEFAYLYVDRARAWKGLKNYGNAEEDYGRAIELEPDVEWHYLDRSRVRIQYFYDLEGAMKDLRTLESINPDNLFANIYMAGILDEWKQYDEAEEYYEKVIAARPDYGYAFEPLAKIAYMQGDFSAARNYFLQAYQFDDRDPLLALAAALCMEKSGDRRSAESLLKEVARKVTRDTVEYEMFRYYLQPGSNFFITDKIKKEKNEDLRSRMYFYLGARDDLKGLRKTALASYEMVEETDFFESDLADWERNNP
ncbi:MAG: tetratricopeptide repeat protein [Spirochaetales bacterium]|nr:tetratricopeptide repeat protein [Spirochaetales bacterium]